MTHPACYNQPRPTASSGYWVMTRKYNNLGEYEMVDTWVPFRNSSECMVDHRHPHPECDGCEHHALRRSQ